MSGTADFLIIGGGVAGLSAAAKLAPHGRVVILEAESAAGYHSSGRSATFSHFGVGNEDVRALTAYSRAFFDEPAEPAAAPLSRPAQALFVATSAMCPVLDDLYVRMSAFADTVRRAELEEMVALFPPLRVGKNHIVAGVIDDGGRRLDAHELLQTYIRTVRAHGGELLSDQRAARIDRTGTDWEVETQAGARWTAPILINAAGAWGDKIAVMAGLQPLGLTPLRRTIIVIDPPAGTDVRQWPFVKTAVDEFYILPEGGRLMASAVDEIPSEPCDARPDDYDVALAAFRVEIYTTLAVPRIAHRWAGLRTFVADRRPVAGFAPDASGFFWLVGQGGYGLQTAPAMADMVEALILGREWPAGLAATGVTADTVSPARPL